MERAQTGRVLLYAAEDALHVVRQRLHGLALTAGVDFAALDIHVITAPCLRLDLPADQDRLASPSRPCVLRCSLVSSITGPSISESTLTRGLLVIDEIEYLP